VIKSTKNKIFKSLQNAEIDDQIISRFASVGLASLSSLLVSVISPIFFSNDIEAAEYIKTYSLALMVSGYLTHVLLFRGSEHKAIKVDVAYIVTVLAALAFMVQVNYEYAIFGIGACVVLFISSVYRISGRKIDETHNGIKRLIYVVMAMLGITASLFIDYDVKFQNGIVLALFVVVPLIVVLRLNVKFGTIKFVRIEKLKNYISFAGAEILPMVAGYVVNVYTLELMCPDEYILFKSWYAIAGLSSLIGALSIVAINRTKKIMMAVCDILIVILPFIAFTIWICKDSMLLLSVSLMLIFSVGAALNAYGKAYLDKKIYLLSNFIPAFVVSSYVMLSSSVFAREMLLMLAIVQLLYAFVMSVYIKYYNFGSGKRNEINNCNTIPQ